MNHLHTILAALRCYQPTVGDNLDVDDIATDSGRLPLPTEDDIDDLCERLNCGQESLPEIPPFTDTELNELLEIASVSLRNKVMHDRLSEVLDLNAEYLRRLRERVRNYLDHAEPATVRGASKQHIVCEVICQHPSVSVHPTAKAALEHAVQCAIENTYGPILTGPEDRATAEASLRETLQHHDCIREGDYEVYLLNPNNT